MEKYYCRWCKSIIFRGELAEKLLILHLFRNHGFTKSGARNMVAAWVAEYNQRVNE